MYAVVGCSDCGNVWLLSDPGGAETARCSRCRTRHRVDSLRRFFESEDREAARQARAAMLAERSDAADAFENLESVAEMERRLDDAGVDDGELLAASGVDPEEVAAVDATPNRSGPRSREEVVREAVREADPPTEEGIVAYAAEHGVPEAATRELLEKLRRRGEVTERGGEYRPL